MTLLSTKVGGFSFLRGSLPMSVSLTLYPTQERAPLPNGCSLCCRRISLFLGGRLPSSLGSLSAMPVEGLPIVLASGFIADPSLEIGPAAVGVIVLVILTVIPVALLVPLPIIWSLPLVVDMHVVVLLAVGPLLVVIRYSTSCTTCWAWPWCKCWSHPFRSI